MATKSEQLNPSKKGNAVVPVAACKGWMDACEYCDKRFGAWIPWDEETPNKIPEQPGILQLALKNKSVTEVVDIVLETSNMQNVTYDKIESLRSKISNKKSKATKSDVLIRCHAFKKIDDRDSCLLYAHWYNLGVMPKFLKAWPGENYLRDCKELAFSDSEQKWCYPQKNPIWRKPKAEPSTVLEVVPGCEWTEDCEFCDMYFKPWQPYYDATDENSIPFGTRGFLLLGVKFGKKREVLRLSFSYFQKKDSTVDIKNELKNMKYDVSRITKRHQNSICEVRWAEIKDVNSEDACLLYAHFLNADKMPPENDALPGEAILMQNQNFEYHMKRKKWCTRLVLLVCPKKGKSKSRKEIWDEIDAQLNSVHIEEE